MIGLVPGVPQMQGSSYLGLEACRMLHWIRGMEAPRHEAHASFAVAAVLVRVTDLPHPRRGKTSVGAPFSLGAAADAHAGALCVRGMG